MPNPQSDAAVQQLTSAVLKACKSPGVRVTKQPDLDSDQYGSRTLTVLHSDSDSAISYVIDQLAGLMTKRKFVLKRGSLGLASTKAGWDKRADVKTPDGRTVSTMSTVDIQLASDDTWRVQCTTQVNV